MKQVAADEGGKMLCYENGKMLGAAIKEFNDVLYV